MQWAIVFKRVPLYFSLMTYTTRFMVVNGNALGPTDKGSINSIITSVTVYLFYQERFLPLY